MVGYCTVSYYFGSCNLAVIEIDSEEQRVTRYDSLWPLD